MDCCKIKEQFKNSMFYTLIMCLCAHGYRFLNLLNSHDSMLNIVQDDVYWQRSLGRFMQPFVMVMRGAICAPWLLCLNSVIFLGLSVFFVCIIFQIHDKLTILILAGIMTSNIVLTTAYAAFLPWVDVYAIALFLSLLGVWCCARKEWFMNVGGCLLIALSMGFYQAYVSVAVAGMMILSVCILMEEPRFKEVCRRIGRFLLCIVVSGILYYILYKSVCVLHHVQLADTYNGLSSIGEFSEVSVWQLVLGAYKEFFGFFRYSNTFSSIILMGIKVSDSWRVLLFVAYIAVCIVIVMGIIRYAMLKKNSWWRTVLQIVVVFLFPLGVNAIYIISKGMEHVLMVYSFLFVYVLALVIIKKNRELKQRKNFEIVNVGVLVIPFLLVIWNSVVFSNQIYYKVHLQQEATQSVITKILYEIEHMDEYEYGVTPVAFVGNFNQSQYIGSPEYFNEISVLGVGGSPLTYLGVESSYIKYFMNNKLNVVNIGADSERIVSMPQYPSKGSIVYMDGVIVVKISD